MKSYKYSYTCFLSRLKSIRGVSAVEFALLMTVLMPIFAGIVDFSRWIYNLNEVAQATRAGAQYATYAPTDYTNIASTITNSTTIGSNSGFSVSANQCYCGLNLATQMLVSNYQSPAVGGHTPNVALGACTTVLPQCTSGNYRGYLQISATYTITPILGSLSLVPASANSTIYLRVQ